jgi:hypothetical protein
MSSPSGLPTVCRRWTAALTYDFGLLRRQGFLQPAQDLLNGPGFVESDMPLRQVRH